MVHVPGWQFLCWHMTRISVVSHPNYVGRSFDLTSSAEAAKGFLLNYPEHLLAGNRACLCRSFQDPSVEFRAIVDTAADPRSRNFSGYRIYRKRREVSPGI